MTPVNIAYTTLQTSGLSQATPNLMPLTLLRPFSAA
jgi:hypothetical protein